MIDQFIHHSFIHPFIHSFIHSFINAYINEEIHAKTHLDAMCSSQPARSHHHPGLQPSLDLTLLTHPSYKALALALRSLNLIMQIGWYSQVCTAKQTGSWGSLTIQANRWSARSLSASCTGPIPFQQQSERRLGLIVSTRLETKYKEWASLRQHAHFIDKA